MLLPDHLQLLSELLHLLLLLQDIHQICEARLQLCILLFLHPWLLLFPLLLPLLLSDLSLRLEIPLLSPKLEAIQVLSLLLPVLSAPNPAEVNPGEAAAPAAHVREETHVER